MIRFACVGRDGETNEDRVFLADNAAVVLDGASQPEPSAHDGGWYATVLGQAVAQRLQTQADVNLADILRQAIAAVAHQYALSRGGPSAAIAILRWSSSSTEALVLGDCTVAIQRNAGAISVLTDQRLHSVAKEVRERSRATSDPEAADAAWRELVDQERAARNREGGYWIAESLPDAALYAKTRRWPRGEIVSALVVTDGVSIGVDDYRRPSSWARAFAIAKGGPADLIRYVTDAEDEDIDRRRWPRHKRHDDKTVCLVDFDS